MAGRGARLVLQRWRLFANVSGFQNGAACSAMAVSGPHPQCGSQEGWQIGEPRGVALARAESVVPPVDALTLLFDAVTTPSSCLIGKGGLVVVTDCRCAAMQAPWWRAP